MASISVTGIAKSISLGILNAFGAAIASVAGQIEAVGSSILEEVGRVYTRPYTGRVLLGLTVDAIEQGANILKSEFATLIAHQTGSADLAQDIQGAQGFQTFMAMAQSIGIPYLTQVLNFFPSAGDINYQSATMALQQFIGLNLLIGTNAWVYNVLGETFSDGHIRALGSLPEMVDKSVGLARLTRVMLNPYIKLLIADPIERGVNAAYLPNTFALTDIIHLYLTGQMDEETTKTLMHEHGFDDANTSALIQMHSKKFDKKELKQLFDYGSLSEEDLATGIQFLMHTPDDTKLITPFIQNERVYHFNEKIADRALALYETGKLKRDECEQFLQTSHWQPEEITTALQFADMSKLQVSLTRDEILALHKYKIYSDSQVVTALEGLGYSADDTNLLLELEIAKEKPKPPHIRILGGHVLSVAEIVKAYKERIFDANKASTELKMYGFSDSDIQILLAENPPK